MISFVRGLALALIAVGFCLPLGAPAQAGCVGLSGTADGFDKETAVSRAQLALADYVKEYKAAKHLSAVNVSAMRASPQPYWRSSVSDNQRFAGSSGASINAPSGVGLVVIVILSIGTTHHGLIAFKRPQ